MKESYLPLHHKYRPKKFDDLVGQVMIAKTLKQALVSNKIAPAYLFCGPRGTGKTSSARILARSLNCISSENSTIDPCGTCEICKAISIGTALDVIEIDAASNTGVDNIRDLIEKSRFAPVQARWKVYVIDECHMLSTAAFNALLKTLEEPPAKNVFILATTDPQKLLPTIISRCQRFDFRSISLQLLEQNLEEIANNEKIKVSKEALNLIAQRSQGGLRDAQRMLDQLSLLPQPIELKSVWELLGEVPEKEMISLASALVEKDTILILKICRNLIDLGNEPIAILQGLAAILRDIIIIKSAPDTPDLCSISNDLYSELSKVSLLIDNSKIFDWQAYLKGSESQIRQSYQPRLWLEVLLFGLLSDKQRTIKEHANKELNNYVTTRNEKAIESNNRVDVITQLDKEVNKVKVIEEVKADEKSSIEEQWSLIIDKIELPSTRMLLSQQACLTNLTHEKAEINVASNWIGMIQSRKNIIEKAIEKAIGSPRKVILNASNVTKESRTIDVGSKGRAISSEVIQSDIKKGINENLVPKNNQQVDTANNEVDQKTQRFADFFNGEIVEP